MPVLRDSKKRWVGKKTDPNLPEEDDELNTSDPIKYKKKKTDVKKNCLAMNQLYHAFRKNEVIMSFI